ncbi:unnamed protein product, partial [Allacma fusca]
RIFWKLHRSYFHSSSVQRKQTIIANPYLIRTEKCSIPKTPVMPEYFQKTWRVDNIPDCEYEVKNFILAGDEESLTFLPRSYEEKCCVREIQATISNNASYGLSKCEHSPHDFADVKNKEMFVVVCNSSINFEAKILVKPNVQKKLDFWKDQEKPPNILILGIDSVSRLHAHRSLPKTLSLLKAMNFLEFKGYHSTGASTLKNFLPVLMGKNLREIRSTCSANWTSKFDDCPLIWKFFDDRNFITNFLEDGEGSFNWGGQGGFTAPPTDYYIQPMFKALRDMRLASFSPRATWWTRELYTNCMSSESVPEFLLRYTRQFTEKFFNAPFFSFTWLAYPFHENVFTLASIDDPLKEFFQYLQENTYLLDNTVIIFISDHGDRTSFFQSASIEGFIERSLPPLFVRIPPKFRQSLPMIHINAMKNTKQLVTPYDIHHTLLHTLNVFTSPEEAVFDSFSPSLSDRSSIFEEISRDRDCESVNIPLNNCVCDTVVSDMVTNTPLFLGEILRLVTIELNLIVENSKYRRVCHQWVTRIEDVLSFRYLGRINNYRNYIIVFVAYPGSAHFEARFVINENGEQQLGVKLIGQFSRVNPYGDQSSCVGFESDSDKEMKQFCFCDD